MSVKVIAFFNNKGGVGKTSLVYHLAWMFADQGKRVLAVDLDPQANLSAAFLDEETLEELWSFQQPAETIYGSIYPLKTGQGDISPPWLVSPPQTIARRMLFDNSATEERLALLAGDMALSSFEDDLSDMWPRCLDKNERAFRVMSAFWRVMQKGAATHQADVILVDLGPNLGAINRAALISSDFIVIPLAADLFSLQGLSNLGPVVRNWRKEWEDRLSRNPQPNLKLPSGNMLPIGYIVMQHSVRQDRPVRAYDRWIAQIPEYYREFVLAKPCKNPPSAKEDEHCFAFLKHYRSLMPLAQEARKPMFYLKPADGAIGAHANAAYIAYKDFRELAREIGRRAGIVLK
jgi:chromosome partitioning protein